MFIVAALLALTAQAPSALAQPVRTNAVYDGDRRVDMYQVSDPKILALADSVVSVFATDNLHAVAGGFSVSTDPMEKSMKVCHDEKFAGQPTPADCSGVLVGPNRIFTAGHCVSHRTCAQTAFVFGYRMTSASRTTTQFPLSDVYYCSHIVARKNTDSVDYAIIDLDRSVLGRTPVPLATDDVEAGEKVYLLSHPAGTPLKYSAPVGVTKVKTHTFTSPLDALGGSSGGPVFSQARNELVGILVSGEDDYVDDKTHACRRVNKIEHCGQVNECDGEDSTAISTLIEAAQLAR